MVFTLRNKKSFYTHFLLVTNSEHTAAHRNNCVKYRKSSIIRNQGLKKGKMKSIGATAAFLFNQDTHTMYLLSEGVPNVQRYEYHRNRKKQILSEQLNPPRSIWTRAGTDAARSISNESSRQGEV